jgi:hypothetical protein
MWPPELISSLSPQSRISIPSVLRATAREINGVCSISNAVGGGEGHSARRWNYFTFKNSPVRAHKTLQSAESGSKFTFTIEA